jgi:hypothetical protein
MIRDERVFFHKKRSIGPIENLYAAAKTVLSATSPCVVGVASFGQHRRPMHVVGDSDHGNHGEKGGSREILRRIAPGIPMMETAHPGA